jgi:ribose 5-phosphate isomerase A
VVEAVGRRLREGSLRDLICVPTSENTAEHARRLNIPLTELDALDPPQLDLAIDGADEVAPDLALIKGLGGALLREKIVVSVARRFVVVVDVAFGWRALLPHLERFGARPALRLLPNSTQPFVTDEGNYILDCRFPPIDDPLELDRRIRDRAGVVETGLFARMASQVVVAGASGVRLLERT